MQYNGWVWYHWTVKYHEECLKVEINFISMTQLWAVSSCQQQIPGSLPCLFIDLYIGSPPAIPNVLTGTVLLLVSFFSSPTALYVAFWCFKRSVECDRPSFSNVLLLALMPDQSNSLERLGEGEMGDQLSQGLTAQPQLSYIFLSVSRMWVKQ